MTHLIKQAALAAATSALMIMSAGEVKAVGTGTGFFINAKGDIVTNHHVIRGFYHYKNGKKEAAPCRKIAAYYKHNIYPVRVIASDPHNDLAVLRITSSGQQKNNLVAYKSSAKPQLARLGWTNINQALQPGRQIGGRGKQTISTLNGVKFRYLPLAFSSVGNGDKVHVFGFPLNGTLSSQMKVASGSINSTSGYWNNSSGFQIDATVHPGNSGSPVLDDKGNLIGVITSGLGDKSVVNFAVKGNVLRAFLRGNDIKYEYKYSEKPITAEGLYYRMKKSVVQIACFDYYEK